MEDAGGRLGHESWDGGCESASWDGGRRKHGIRLLNVPEDKLAEVIRVIRAGLKSEASRRRRAQLSRWCDEEERYLLGLAEEAEA